MRRPKVWVEVTCGYSMSGYRMLDMYVSVRHAGLPPPPEEAWYLLNSSTPYDVRQVPSPGAWWQYTGDMAPYGQRESMLDEQYPFWQPPRARL